MRGAEALFSSTKTSVIKVLTTDGLTGAHLRDHTTTPEVVMISKVSNMVWLWSVEVERSGSSKLVVRVDCMTAKVVVSVGKKQAVQ